MTTTISNISSEIKSIISKNNTIEPISEQEKINNFLDNINNLKNKFCNRIENLKKLDTLFTLLTWSEISNQDDEKLLKDILSKSKKFHTKALQNYAFLNSALWKQNICRLELSDYKNSLDDFEETIFEVEEIFFSLRKDNDFNDLLNSL